jgi:Fe-S-cluster-containing hydrogenase component 2
MQEQTGVPSAEQIARTIPPKERLAQGPVAVVECFQEIPCNPCATSCSTGAIHPFADINDLPQIDWEKCNGCTRCVGFCPGLAIFIVDDTYSETESIVKIPWEFSYLPREGEEVAGLNREGREVARVKIKKIQPSPRKNRAHILWLVVPKEQAFAVRSIELKQTISSKVSGG